MKKITLIFVLFAFIGLNLAQAQVQVAIGVKGGLNFAKVDVKNAGTTYDGRTGFHGGAFVLVKLTKIGIQPEVLFSKQGSQFSLNGQTLKQDYNYINIPIIIKLYLAAGLNLQLGPQIGFLASAKTDVLDLATNKVTSTDIKNQLKSNDTSLALGAGWDLPFGLTIDARYNLGLSKINVGTSSSNAKNQVFMVSLGYKLIKIGK